MRLRVLPILLLTLAWAGCGSGPSSSNTTPPPTGGGTGSGGGTSPLTAPQVITVAANGTTSGVNIVVPATKSAFNVTMLGVNSPSATTASASNTGGAVARGATALVLVFGTALKGSETLSFSGPNDITITNQRGVKATDGTPGIEFTIAVSSGAAVGARTLRITDSSGNASAFVGGLEVF